MSRAVFIALYSANSKRLSLRIYVTTIHGQERGTIPKRLGNEECANSPLSLRLPTGYSDAGEVWQQWYGSSTPRQEPAKFTASCRLL